jgi:hypothetical protein
MIRKYKHFTEIREYPSWKALKKSENSRNQYTPWLTMKGFSIEDVIDKLKRGNGKKKLEITSLRRYSSGRVARIKFKR